MSDRPQSGSPGTTRAWRSLASRAGIVLCLAAVVAMLAVQVPQAVSTLDNRASRSASFSYEDRLFAAGNSIIPDKQLLYEAEAWIPRHGTYRVNVGQAPIADASDLTRTYAPTFATYYLMPRRLSPDSRWVLCLGCDLATVSKHVTTVWSDGEGSSLLRVER